MENEGKTILLFTENSPIGEHITEGMYESRETTHKNEEEKKTETLRTFHFENLKIKWMTYNHTSDGNSG